MISQNGIVVKWVLSVELFSAERAEGRVLSRFSAAFAADSRFLRDVKIKLCLEYLHVFSDSIYFRHDGGFLRAAFRSVHDRFIVKLSELFVKLIEVGLEICESEAYLRFVRELEQGKPTVRMDKVNQALAMFGAVAVPGRMTVDE